MLPWDRLAQYVTQGSFEWLDWIPGFGGTLIRNFILPEHVSNRLFSLLVFIHIGQDLIDGFPIHAFLPQFIAQGPRSARSKALALLQPEAGKCLVVEMMLDAQALKRSGNRRRAVRFLAQALFHLGLAAWPVSQ